VLCVAENAERLPFAITPASSRTAPRTAAVTNNLAMRLDLDIPYASQPE
jgi:hypothetical protein